MKTSISAILHGEPGSGKAVSHGSRVPTPTGWTLIEDVKPGDLVLGTDGPTEVTHVWPQGERDIYRVTFLSGVSAEVDGDHLWTIRSAQKDIDLGPTKTTEILNQGIRNGSGRIKFRTPFVGAVSFPDVTLPLDPYALGAIIGDSHISASGSVALVGCDQFIFDEVSLRLSKSFDEVSYGLDNNRNSEGCAQSRLIKASLIGHGGNALNRLMKSIGLAGKLSWEKSIPELYLRSSVDQRLDLLRGLMDTDGTLTVAPKVGNRKGGSTYCEFSTTSETLGLQVQDVVRSLGGVSRIYSRMGTYTKDGVRTETRINYRVSVSMPEGRNPFLLPRKADLWRANKDLGDVASITTGISSIEYVGRNKATCLTVTADDHLFLLDGYVLTHNSWAGATAPAPRLLLDAEGGGRFCKRNKPMVQWNPNTEAPPEWDGSWQSCFVSVQDWVTFDAAHQWLASGQHPFRSVVLDSLTELQKRLVDAVSGIQQPTMQQWGEVLRRMEDKCRAFRDLAVREDNSLEAVIAICLSHTRDGQIRPFVKGSLELSLPGFFDIVAYLYTAQDEATGAMLHQGLIAPLNGIIAKDRTNVLIEKFGPAVQEVNIESWLKLIHDEGF